MTQKLHAPAPISDDPSEIKRWQEVMAKKAWIGWKDIPGDLDKAIASGPGPTSATLAGNINGWRFSSSTTNSLQISFFVNHDIAPGSIALPHVHWINMSNTSNGTVRWGFEVYKLNGGDRVTTTTTAYVTQNSDGTGQVAEVSEADAIRDITPGTIIKMRVFRDASNDTCTDNVFALFADLHVITDRVATPKRRPPFYEYY